MLGGNLGVTYDVFCKPLSTQKQPSCEKRLLPYANGYYEKYCEIRPRNGFDGRSMTKKK